MGMFTDNLFTGIVWFSFDRRVVPTRLNHQDKWARTPEQAGSYVGHFGFPYRRMMGTMNTDIIKLIYQLLGSSVFPIFNDSGAKKRKKGTLQYEPAEYNLIQVFDVLCTEYRCIPLPKNHTLSPPYKAMPTHYSNAQRAEIKQKLLTNELAKSGGMRQQFTNIFPPPPDGDVVMLDYLPFDKNNIAEFKARLQLCINGLTRQEMLNWMENINIDYPKIYQSSVSDKMVKNYIAAKSTKRDASHGMTKKKQHPWTPTPSIQTIRNHILGVAANSPTLLKQLAGQTTDEVSVDEDTISDVTQIHMDTWGIDAPEPQEMEEFLSDEHELGKIDPGDDVVPDDIHDQTNISDRNFIDELHKQILKDGQEYK